MIDMVVVNLYPFEATVAKPDVTLEDAIENIDIGGPSMVRSAAKNYRSVAIVTNPARYAAVLEEMRANGGAVTDRTRARTGGGGVYAHLRLRHGDLQLAARASARRSGPALGARLSAARSSRTCATAKIRTRRPPFTALAEVPRRTGWRPPTCCRARSSPSITISTWKRCSPACANSTAPTAYIVKHTSPCGVASTPRSGAGLCRCAGMRPAVRVRRHRRLQPRSGRATPRGRMLDGMAKYGFLECILAPTLQRRRRARCWR